VALSLPPKLVALGFVASCAAIVVFGGPVIDGEMVPLSPWTSLLTGRVACRCYMRPMEVCKVVVGDRLVLVSVSWEVEVVHGRWLPNGVCAHL
jgi:hypothetical protein